MRNSLHRNNEGYTLVESLVAMALFLCAVIPLISTIGIFMFRDSGDNIRVALDAAESDITATFLKREFVDINRVLQHNLVLHRTIRRNGRLVSVDVQVFSSDNRKKLVELERDYFGGL